MVKDVKKIVVISVVVLLIVLPIIYLSLFGKSNVAGQAVQRPEVILPNIEIDIAEIERKAIEAQVQILQEIQLQVLDDLKDKLPGEVTIDSAGNWLEVPLDSVVDGETFTLFDLSVESGKPILLDSFAVWCPFCIQQQDEVQKLHEAVGDDVVSISVNTDPNEDEEIVRNHIIKHGYEWEFAVSKVEFTRELVSEFGIGVVNAPSAPVILICKDQQARMLDRGVKLADRLKEEIALGC